jgi:PAS domain S-box-containing protein
MVIIIIWGIRKMLNSLRSRILLVVIFNVFICGITISYFVQKEAKQTLSTVAEDNARKILHTVMLNVETQYQSLLFHNRVAMERKKNERKNIVTMAINVIRGYHARYKDGSLTEEDAKQRAIRAIKYLRYEEGGEGYIWINDTARPIPTMIMHSAFPHLENKTMDSPEYMNILADPDKSLGEEIVDICLRNGSGYVEYLWPKPAPEGFPKERQKKVSYIELFKEWNWIVGSGVYNEDIQEESDERLKAIIDELDKMFANVKLSGSGYFFIFTGDQKLIVHPTIEAQDGRHLMNPVTQKPIFEELIAAAKTKDKSFTYIWDRPEHPGEYRFQKKAYIEYFEPLNWYVGASLYLDDIQMGAKVLGNRILYISTFFLVIAVILSVILSRNLAAPLNKLMLSLTGFTKDNINAVQIPLTGTIETRELGIIIDDMIQSIRLSMRENEALLSALKKAQEVLEQKVEERTAELNSKNVLLEKEIIERQLAEDKSKEQYQFIMTLLDTIPSPICYKNTDHQYIGCNKAFAELVGKTREDIIGKTVFDMLDSERAQPYYQKDLEILNNPGKQQFECATYFNGELRDLIFYKATFNDNKGKVLGIIGIMLDITQLKKTEQSLREAKQKAEQASRAKSIFLSNMTHELRTPMNAILGYSQLMRRDSMLPTNCREYLDIINSSGKHLLALINDVLEISKIETKQITFDTNAFNLWTLLNDLTSMFKVKTDSKNLKFSLIRHDNVPHYVFAPESKLRQVLINILGNAVKFTDNGFIEMRVFMKNKHRLAFDIEDTGAGIAPHEINKAFEYFEQTESGRKSKSGTGLGLAISRDYIHMMGGEISVASEVNKGSTFHFEIPVKEAQKSDFDAIVPKKRVIGLAPDQKIPRILVAEDNKQNRDLIVTLLETVGFQVKEAINGKDAVRLAQEWRPHFVWMDIRMPELDGIQAVQMIRTSMPDNPPVLAALTAQAVKEDQEIFLKEGFDACVHKPFREDEIFGIMSHYLGVKYIYEDEDNDIDPYETNIKILAQQLEALPNELRTKLYQAVIELDKETILRLIDDINKENPYIGGAVKQIATQLDYNYLLQLLEYTDTQSGRP